MSYAKKLLLNHVWIYFFVGCLLILLATAPPASAQTVSADTADTAEPAWPEDSLGRRTPRGTVAGFIRAVANEDYALAAQFLRIDPELRENHDGARLAQGLQRLLDQNGHINPYSLISNNPEGTEDDNLGPNLDRVGTATANGEEFTLMLERTEGPDGGPVWLFSSQTVQRIPLGDREEAFSSLVDRLSPRFLAERRWGGVPTSHWLALVVLVAMAYLVAWGITELFLFLIPKFWLQAKTDPTAGIVKAFSLPIRIYLTVWILVASSQEVGISIVLRQRLSQFTMIFGLIALLLLLWQLVSTSTSFAEKQLIHRNNMAGVSAVLFLQRAAKIALLVLGVILVLDNFGVNVTTGLAALGIGGIALALGAQKTVENFVGSVTLIADQPVRVGDFCKVGDTVGTVEQIGMRSTRIRTLDRTIVTIPNGDFSSQRIENFAHRDRFRFAPTFGLRFETTPDQIRYLLVELRSILYAHPNVNPDPARIRFKEIGADALKLEIFSYINAKDFNQFLEVQEDLYLRMMDVIAASGTGFAFPSQTLYIARDHGVSGEKAEEIKDKVQKWREAGEMQIPTFDPERIQHLKNTIPWPPEGSSMPPDLN